ncbi:MAG TPA: DUF2163 domain-containing protein [Beijerinckiaceae bacterium]|nr:DUF2163 domain-containing protein [Beijerinckiaceae bacterium]
MKSVSAALAQHLAGPVTTLATCWRITRRDGRSFFFTDHDRDLLFEGDLYLASAGYSRTAISNDASLSVDNLDVEGVFDSAAITEEELRAGLFDHAEVRIFLVNWAAPSQGALRMRRGWFGEVVLNEQGTFRTELRGMTQALQQQIGELYSPECRADLGDHRCKVPLADWTRSGLVTSVLDRTAFTAAIDGSETPDGWFAGGVLTFQTGANAGRAIEVKAWTVANARIELYLALAYPVVIGGAFRIHPGCDKRLSTCIERFDNVLNFRGEPYVPGQDAMMSYPNAR